MAPRLNLEEALRRVHKLANWIGALGFLFGIFISAIGQSNGKYGVGKTLFMLAVPLLFATALHVVCWILGGLLVPQSSDARRF